MSDDPQTPVIGLVCSHGGHLTEMLELRPALEGYRTFYFCYDADTTRRLENAYRVPNRPYDPLQFIRNLIYLFRIYRKEKPAFILSTGAEIAIPAFLMAKLFRLPTLYIECGAQVTRPSYTGRLLCRIATRFLVQWPELLEVYGSRAQYQGSLIDETPPIGTDSQ